MPSLLSHTWPDLTPIQADGVACVVCGCDYLTTRVTSRPVGRSALGSQVFACVGPCTDQGAATVTGGAR